MAESPRLVDVLAEQAPPPRANGELVFDQPWEGRVFGVAVAAQEAGLFTAEEFRQALIVAIAGDPDARYYANWSQALLSMMLEKRLLDQDSIDGRMRELQEGTFDEVR
ncbi:hypothetical protein BH11ACT6_BH11ACT6_60210 [soil metagenome]